LTLNKREESIGRFTGGPDKMKTKGQRQKDKNKRTKTKDKGERTKTRRGGVP
jgi:hypothetical protein